MVTYKNLRDVEKHIMPNIFGYITTLTVDVYEANIILGWFKNKSKFIKTDNLIRVYNTWKDLNNVHIPIDNVSQIESLLHDYELLQINLKHENLVIEAIKGYR